MVTAVIDYGLSNLLSVSNAVKYLGYDAITVSSPEDLAQADKLILPGVGAFGDGMNGLKKLGLDKAIIREVSNGKPFLGICLGMQMLFDESEEFGTHRGLGLIHGTVIKIPDLDTGGAPQYVPNIGWRPLIPHGTEDFSGTILEQISNGDECYFVHSYEAVPSSDTCRIADILYGGRYICAAVSYENVMGTQFHPEKSGQVGLNILKSFLA